MLSLGVPHQNAETNPVYYRDTLSLLSPPGWYNWKFDRLGDKGYNPMLWKVVLGSQYDQAVAKAKVNPGHVWLLGNEPEPELPQSKTSPTAFRDTVKKWLAAVGGQWAGPGVLWWDPGRKWLDEYLRIGGPVPNYWAIHIYGSWDLTTWKSQYSEAINWFAARGVGHPIWVTETNIAGNAEVQAPLLDYLMRAPVRAWWYSAYDPFKSNAAADLTTVSGNKTTTLGYRYASYNYSQESGGSSSIYLPIINK